MLEQHIYNMQDILLNTQKKKKTHSYIIFKKNFPKQHKLLHNCYKWIKNESVANKCSTYVGHNHGRWIKQRCSLPRALETAWSARLLNTQKKKSILIEL